MAAALGVHELTVDKWRRHFLADRIGGFLDEARAGRRRTIGYDQVVAVIERTLRTTPTNATHWSISPMVAETGFSHAKIRRVWNAFGLQPHRSLTFKLSSDRCLWTRIAILSRFTYRRRPVRSSSVSMRRVRSRRWTASSLCGP